MGEANSGHLPQRPPGYLARCEKTPRSTQMISKRSEACTAGGGNEKQMWAGQGHRRDPGVGRRPQGGVAGQSLQKAEPSQGREHREERERERRERMQRCPTRQVHRVEITDCRTISAEAHPYCVRIKRNPLL